MHKMGIRGPWQGNPISKPAHLSLVHFLGSPEKGKRAAIKHIESYNLWGVSAQYTHSCNVKKRDLFSSSSLPSSFPLPGKQGQCLPSPLLSWHVCAGHRARPCPALELTELTALPAGLPAPHLCVLLISVCSLPRSTEIYSNHFIHLNETV